MTRSYSISEIDPEGYPLFLNIKNELVLYDSHLIQKRFNKIFSNYKRCKIKCENLKTLAIRKNDEDCANISFLLKTNFSLIYNIAKFWNSCERYEYYDAWDTLQDALDQNRFLLRYLDPEKHHSMVQSYEYLSLIEKLFPFQVFISSALDKLEVKCSICNKSSFDPECNHIPGNLYWGEIAQNIVEKIGGCNHIALVPNPADKRLILQRFMYDKKNPEDSPFRNVYTFIKCSSRPLKELGIQYTTKEVPRSDFTSVPEEWPCPCGGGTSFKDCCYEKETITIPHINIYYDSD